jgi:hypothetical protein
MQKTRTIIAKILATMGALGIAIVIAEFIHDISNKYFDIVIGNLERYPPSSTILCPAIHAHELFFD